MRIHLHCVLSRLSAQRSIHSINAARRQPPKHPEWRFVLHHASTAGGRSRETQKSVQIQVVIAPSERQSTTCEFAFTHPPLRTPQRTDRRAEEILIKVHRADAVVKHDAAHELFVGDFAQRAKAAKIVGG